MKEVVEVVLNISFIIITITGTIVMPFACYALIKLIFSIIRLDEESARGDKDE